jgi:hypothetical protein
MTSEQLEKLFEYIDARFAELKARDDFDGGLHEHVVALSLREELRALVQDPT